MEEDYGNPDKYSYAGINLEEMTRLFSKFQFDSLLSEWSDKSNTQGLLFDQKPSQVEDENVVQNYKTIGRDQFEEWLKKLSKQKVFAFDTETTSLNVRQAKLVGVSFSWGEADTYYLPFGHQNESEKFDNLDMALLKQVLSYMKR